jgi:hypothetical protein
MPVLIRYTDMTESQRKNPMTVAHLTDLREMRQTRDDWAGRPWNQYAQFDWHFAVWFMNNGKRPVENRDPVYLSEETPFEVLTTIRHGGTRPLHSLIEATLVALRTNVLDSKEPILVLCDCLEEQGMPEADLLRAFVARKQRWDRYCLNVGEGGGEKGGT